MQAPNTTEFLNDENDDSVPEEKKSVNEGSSNQVDDDDGLTKEEHIEDLKELEEEGT